MSFIANLAIDAKAPGGDPFVINIEIGAPYRHARYEAWACDLSLAPLHEDLRPAVAQDSLQALCLALRLAGSLLEGFVQRGGVLSMEGERFPLEAYFDPPFVGLRGGSDPRPELG